MAVAGKGRIPRLMCAALLGGLSAAGALHAGFGVDVLKHLPGLDLCLLHALGDFSCPGCGMLRGLLRAAQLRFAEATAFHPLAVPFALAISWLAAGSPGRRLLSALPKALRQGALALAILVVLGVYFVRLAGGLAL